MTTSTTIQTDNPKAASSNEESANSEKARIANSARFAAGLKQLIDSVYAGGISKVLKYDVTEKGAITGFFHDLDDLYRFEVSPSGILNYVESDKNELRGDSYLIGFYTDSGLSTLPIIVRSDKSIGRKKQCREGKPCGNTCIAKGIKCESMLKPEAKRGFFNLRNALARQKGFTLPSNLISAAATGAAIAGAGAVGIAVGKTQQTAALANEGNAAAKLRQAERKLNIVQANKASTKGMEQRAGQFMAEIFKDEKSRQAILSNPRATRELVGVMGEFGKSSATKALRKTKEKITQRLTRQTLKPRSQNETNKSVVPTVKNLPSTNTKTSTNSSRQWKKAAAVGATMVGVPLAGYLSVRAKYRSGFSESAKLAEQQAEELKVPNTLVAVSKSGSKQADQITLVVGGFANEGGRNGKKWAQQFMNEGDEFSSHHVASVDNKEFEFDFDKYAESPLNVAKYSSDPDLISMDMTTRVMLGNIFEKGRNPVAVKMAAQAYAYHKKHPDKPINLLGYSGGGMVTHEAAEILKKMKVPVKVANFGSPYFGMTQKAGDSITFASEQDSVLSDKIIRDRINTNTVKNHYDYLKNKQVRSELKNFFEGKSVNSDKKSEMTAQEKEKAKRKREQVKRLKQKQKEREIRKFKAANTATTKQRTNSTTNP